MRKAAILLLALTARAQSPEWLINSVQITGQQATVSKAAGAGSTKHVVDCVGFSAAASVAPSLTFLNISVIDGASGGANVLLKFTVTVPASTGTLVAPFAVCGIGVAGTAATAMTIEFSASATNLAEQVWMSG